MATPAGANRHQAIERLTGVARSEVCCSLLDVVDRCQQILQEERRKRGSARKPGFGIDRPGLCADCALSG